MADHIKHNDTSILIYHLFRGLKLSYKLSYTSQYCCQMRLKTLDLHGVPC